ncbi:MAG: hypothetical protein SGPRY_003628 [Prymnesium sp.]
MESVAVGVLVEEGCQRGAAELSLAPQHRQKGSALLAQKHSFPPGLLQAIVASIEAFPLRVWVVDNSGSMNMSGGSRIVESKGKVRASHACACVNVTRWAELGDSVRMAAEITTALGARTDFNLLNATPAGQFFTVGFDERIGIPPNTLCDEAGMSKVMSESPCGRTPLTQAVQAIIAAVAPVAHKLQASGQQVAVIIATDGLPDDSNSFLAALQQLQQLPVWIVVRLCTDDVRSRSTMCEAVVEYWGSLDKQLEAPLEVLDDLIGESEEIYAVSPWLTYGPPLHYAREFGSKNKLFDLLDERKLLPSQVKELVESILGCKPLPEPEVDISDFIKAVKAEQANIPLVFDPKRRLRLPWFDVKGMRQLISSDSSYVWLAMQCVL